MALECFYRQDKPQAFIVSASCVRKNTSLGTNQSMRTPLAGESITVGNPFRKAIKPMNPDALFSGRMFTSAQPRVVPIYVPINDILCGTQNIR
jgi:hypothetical protein